jgi:hypothetical protein
MVNEILTQIEDDKPDITVDKTVGVLRDHTVSWLWDAYQTLNQPRIIKKLSFSH